MTNKYDSIYNWGHWGITPDDDSLYQEAKEMLEQDINDFAAGKIEKFDTGWHGFKKSEQEMRIFGKEGTIYIKVGQCMDDPYDLIVYDAKNSDKLSEISTSERGDGLIKEIMDRWFEDDGDSDVDYTDMIELSENQTFAKVMKIASCLAEDCDDYLERQFALLNEIEDEVLKREGLI